MPEQSPFGGKAYRIEFDDSFTRLFNPPDGPLSRWTALTTDGVRYDFGNEAGSRYQQAGVFDAGTRWLLTRVVDAHGNEIHYFWSGQTFGPFVEQSLQRIEYGANANAGLAAHAKVELTYAPPDVCVGSSMPVGAAAVGGSVIEGGRRLIRITTSVRDRPGAAWRVARIVSLDYQLRSSNLHYPVLAPVRPPAGLPCTQAPLRYLTAVRTTAYNPGGAATTVPPITFSYNARLQGGLAFGPAPFATRTLRSPGHSLFGNLKGTQGTMLDLDSDGVPDRVSVSEVQRVCTLSWQRGLPGGSFDRIRRRAPLPTAPWSDEVPDPDGHYYARLPPEGCTLNGQVTYRYSKVVENDPEKGKGVSYPAGRAVLSYHFLDFTGDGRIDLLTNVWAVVGDETLVPADSRLSALAPALFNALNLLIAQGRKAPSSAAAAPGQMTPEQDGGYVWRVYRNAGDPQALILGGQPGAVFANRPMKVTTSGVAPRAGAARRLVKDHFSRGARALIEPQPDCGPQPLPPSANDDALDKSVLPSVSIPPLIDIDGDGFLDLIGAIKSAKVLRFDGDWCVYFGNGGGTFRPGKWAVPRISLLIGAAGFNEEITGPNGQRHIKRTTGASLQDMNADGLVDLVVQTTDRMLKTYLNTGSGFRLTPINLGVSSPVEVLQTDYSYAGANGPVVDGKRGYRLRLIDVDGDRLPDLVSTSAQDDDIAAAGRVFVRFNTGDHFNSPVEVPGRWAEARRLFTFDHGAWHLISDFVDADGDGAQDLASWNATGRLETISARPGLPAAADLLSRVENGRGLRVSFSYASSTDRLALSWSHTARNSPFDLPQPTWLVRSLSVGGGFDTPEMVTRFRYADPRLLAASAYRGISERPQFVGMTTARLEIQNSGKPARETTRTFGYDSNGAPDGRLIEERLYLQQGDTRRLRRDTLEQWERRPVLSASTYVATLRSTITRTCLPDTSEAECTGQTENISRSEQVWEPKSCGTAAQALYVRASQQEGIGLAVGDQDRRTLFNHEIVCGGIGQPLYCVLVERTVFDQAVPGSGGTAFEERGDTRVLHDDKCMPIQTDQQQDASTVATTKRSFDQTTGNLLRLTKPEQAAPGGSGKSSVSSYDARGLYVAKRVNELGQPVFMNHDVATGALLERRGPNTITLPSGQTVFERERWRIDGLGRITAHAQSFDDPALGYVLRTVTKTTYYDAALPNRIRTEQLRDLKGSVWVTGEKTMDGLGRTLTESQELGGGRRDVTGYRYDGGGNVSAIEVTDPRRDDGAQVQYSYRYDGLGRLILVTRPDESGLRIVHAGLNRTVTEVAKDGSGSSRTEVFDALGRLITVREQYNDGAAAVSRYRYDGRDSLVAITDADGNTTTVERDWVDRRIAITRGTRSWRYGYDRNNNLISELRPAPAGSDSALATATSRFDDLDRVTSVIFPDIGNPAAPNEKTLATVRYAYDSGRNGVGRLRTVTLPFGEIRYGYDARGLVTSEQRSFVLRGSANVADTQRVQRSYNALAQLTGSRWDDGERSRIGYDQRGLVANVDWYDPSASVWKRVAAFQRSLAGQIRARGSAFGQTRRYTYDLLGRVVEDQVSGHNGDLLATRRYRFTDAGDLASVAGATGDLSAASTYRYDEQHRLRGASGPNGYSGSFTYTRAGNVATADVDWNGSTETRNVRYQYGQTDPQAVDRLIESGNGNAYASFRYEPSGNMLERQTPKGTTTLAWDGLDRLRIAENASGRETYFYDHTGARILAVSNDTVRFWFGESETHYRLDGTKTRRYLHLSGADTTLARVENRNKIELQYADVLQNLMLASDEDGNAVASFLYGPYGEVVKAKGAQQHRRQFNGKEHDALTRLRYYGYRYYDPLVLRWNGADPFYRYLPELGRILPQRLNLYTFSLNNPARYYDADGRDAEIWPQSDVCEVETSCVSRYSTDDCAAENACVDEPEDEETCEEEDVCYPEEAAASPAASEPAEWQPEYESSSKKEVGHLVFTPALSTEAEPKAEHLYGLEVSASYGVGPEGELGNDLANAELSLKWNSKVYAGAGVDEEGNAHAGVGAGTGVEACGEVCVPVFLVKSVCVGGCAGLGLYAEATVKAGPSGFKGQAALGPIKAGVGASLKDSDLGTKVEDSFVTGMTQLVQRGYF